MRRMLRVLCLTAAFLPSSVSWAGAQVWVSVTGWPDPFVVNQPVYLDVGVSYDPHSWACWNPTTCFPYSVSVEIQGSDGYINAANSWAGWSYTGFTFTDWYASSYMEWTFYAVNAAVTYYDAEFGGFYTDYGYGSGDVQPVPPPQTPTGEWTYSVGWADSPNPTFHRFRGVLTGQGQVPFPEFFNRSVREVDSGGGQDYCWRPGDPPTWQFTQVSGFSWPIDANDQYGDDFIGFTNDAIFYYRQRDRAPCHVEVPQRMEISCTGDPRCGPPWEFYQDNWVLFGFTSSEVWANRGGVYVSRIWY